MAMEVTLRVIINSEDIRKIILKDRPSTLDGLIAQLQEKLKLDYDFKLQQEIIKTEPPVKDLLERWPALFTERQVYSEFARIASKNIEMDFFDSLDRHAARLMEMFQTKKGVVGQKISKLLQRQNLANDVTEQRRVIINGLAIILGDDPSEFFKTSSVGEVKEAFLGFDDVSD
uniref:Uncharacterized protein n=1 Tax=Knipowitschia caucasica TaxID=637954 RepID=A0AAV2MHK1_KNICA